MLARRISRKVKVGDVSIGGGAKVPIQSMTLTRTAEVIKTVEAIKQLETAGCDLVRVSVLDDDDAKSLLAIKRQIHIPLIADIHFNWQLALAAIDHGADKIRINPGNIGGKDRIRKVVEACRKAQIPMRVGVNHGSLEEIPEAHSIVETMVASALQTVATVEEHDFRDIVVSMKGNNVVTTIEANRLLAQKTDLPLHLGVTHAGSGQYAVIKSVTALGTLLAEGIGDTIRISLTEDPVKEVEVAKEMLESLELRKRPLEIISCPSCGRAEVDVFELERKVRQALDARKMQMPKDMSLKVSVMGCVVNGPGEAEEADLGISGGRGIGLIMKNGQVLKKVPEGKAVDALIDEIAAHIKKGSSLKL